MLHVRIAGYVVDDVTISAEIVYNFLDRTCLIDQQKKQRHNGNGQEDHERRISWSGLFNCDQAMF